jgi:acetyltransferase-like isoleucine patch superfamily enzyme
MRIREYLWRILNTIQRAAIFPVTLRTLLLRFFGCHIHHTARIREGVYIGSKKLRIDENVFVNIGCFFDGSASISVGEMARLGPYVRILTGTHSYCNSVIRRGPGSVDIKKPVTIERGCWIGMGATILPGVVIKEGCVIAANATVVTSTSANGLYAGVPARRIKDLPVDES